MEKISKAYTNAFTIKLRSPYKLSFTTINSISSNVIKIVTDKGSVGLGECTALPGYGTENHSEVLEIFNKLETHLIGLTAKEAKDLVFSLHSQSPFAASAVGNALDFAFSDIKIPTHIQIPLVFAVSSSSDTNLLRKEIEMACSRGFRTLKIKIGRNIQDDFLTTRMILESDFPMTFRFDANQGYELDEAKAFIDLLLKYDTKQIEFVEQPLNKNEWRNLQFICQYGPIPIMLDESIYSLSDIEKAAGIGARYIKLKLCKTKGIVDLISIAKQANSLGLKIVLGNGVSTDIGNLSEAIAFQKYIDLFYGAFEGNGFTRLQHNLLKNPLHEKYGSLHWYFESNDDEPVFELN